MRGMIAGDWTYVWRGAADASGSKYFFGQGAILGIGFQPC